MAKKQKVVKLNRNEAATEDAKRKRIEDCQKVVLKVLDDFGCTIQAWTVIRGSSITTGSDIVSK